MLIGPTASKREIAAFREKLKARPDNYIAQPTLALSTCPVYTRAGLAPRHVDLRPFVLVSPEGIDITPGGLTRVAMKKGSLVVNSSQGGGHQGYMGAEGLAWRTHAHARPDRQRIVLDVPLSRAGGRIPRACSKRRCVWR